MGGNEFSFEHTKLEISAGHSKTIVPHAVEFMSLEFVGAGWAGEKDLGVTWQYEEISSKVNLFQASQVNK